MPTTISTSSRAWRHPAAPAEWRSDMLSCAALAAVGLLLAVLALNFEISHIMGAVNLSVNAATENVGGVPS